MRKEGDSRYEESFNSFLAGMLLTRNCVNNFDFFNSMNLFSNIYNVDIVSIGEEINIPIYLDDNEIKLLRNIRDIVIINGREMSIESYLYSFTTPRVREFFHIPDLVSRENDRKSKLFARILLRKKIAI